MLIAIFLAIGIGGCKKDYPIPDPPKPQPPISLSQEEIWLIKGMEAEVMVFNSNEFSVSAEKSGIIATRIEGSKIFMGALTPGEVSLIIIDKKDSSRRAVLKIKVSPIRFGLMDTKGNMILEAKYCFQTTKTLHLAPNGTVRKEHYLRVPLLQEFQQGAPISLEYRAPGTEIQVLEMEISLIKERIVYATTLGKYLVFEKK